MNQTLTRTDIVELVRETDQARAQLGPRESFRRPDFLAALARTLQRTRHLRHQPIVAAFIEDALQFDPATPSLVRTKRHINEARDNHLFSLFDASYFPSLSLEYLTYELLGTDEHLAQRYPSNTMPVLLRHHSTGFDARSVVALFPENHIDGLQLGDDLIFYFIDKFVERHYRVTRKLLAAAMARECLPHVRSASVAEVQAASAWWVRLHEYHHRQGDMPIPEFLAVKRRKALAGLEELRVDVSGMLACLGDRSLPAREARLTYEFILAERLLRYAVEGIPRPNYDAVASQVLFNYLTEHGALAVRAGRIHLSAGVDDVLAQFLGEIEAIERRIHEEPKEDVQQRLLAFANAYADVDHAAGDYRHIPYFQDIKERLRV